MKKTPAFVRPKDCLTVLLSSAFLAFGMYHIHAISSITEGGVLGAILLIYHWTGISPAVSAILLNAACYFFGWRTLGKPFLFYSFLAAVGYSAGYALWEQFPPLWPQIASYPLLAAVAGSIFVGVGTGLCVRAGGAASGDDALAMSLSKITGWRIQWVYLISDLSVLLLSLSYIPLRQISYSFLTVILSGQIIGFLQKKNNCR